MVLLTIKASTAEGIIRYRLSSRPRIGRTTLRIVTASNATEARTNHLRVPGVFAFFVPVQSRPKERNDVGTHKYEESEDPSHRFLRKVARVGPVANPSRIYSRLRRSETLACPAARPDASSQARTKPKPPAATLFFVVVRFFVDLRLVINLRRRMQARVQVNKSDVLRLPVRAVVTDEADFDAVHPVRNFFDRFAASAGHHGF